MADGTREEYQFLERLEHRLHTDYVDRLLLLEWVRRNEGDTGYRISRFEHSLQSAGRAYRDGKDEEFVVCCLFHDIGDLVSPLQPQPGGGGHAPALISEKNFWIIRHHGLFQGYYYFHHLGGDRNARDRYKDHPWYDDTVEFCARYDQNCFDPDYESLPLKFFEPMARRVISTRRHDTP